MFDPSAPRAARASASRVVALMAAGGEWPNGWSGLIHWLLVQLAGAAGVVMAASIGSSGGDVGVAETGGRGGERGGGGGREQEDQVNVASAIARAESCVKCLQYMTEEVCKCSAPYFGME